MGQWVEWIFLPDGGEGLVGIRQDDEKRTRRNQMPGFKAKVATGGHEGRQTADLNRSSLSTCTPNEIMQWRKPGCWGKGRLGRSGADRGETKAAPSVDLKALFTPRSARPTLDNDFFQKGR